MSDDNKRQVTITWHDPTASAAAGMAMSGLDYMRAMAEGRLPSAPISAVMNMTGFEVKGEGHVVFHAQPGEQHYNPIGTVHGGFHATLLDSAMACAVHTTLPQGMGYTTLQININYVRAITAGAGLLHAEGRVIHAGRRMATAEGTLKDDAGKLYAHGTTTCAIFELPSR